jgi:hypothetical protein
VTTDESVAGGAGDPWLVGNGTRAVIGGSSYDWFKSSAGGVAYVGVFGNPFYQPAFIFPAQLANGDPKSVWEATSHEVGHNLGLDHDGTSSTGSYSGHGTGAGGWAPIMGVGYYKEVTQFSKGEYAGANNQQDDLAIINGYLLYRADDHGNTASAATELIGAADSTDPARSTAGTVGNIERTADQDWLLVGAGTGQLTVTLSVVAPWGTPPSVYNRADADVKIELRAAGDPPNTVVAFVNQTGGLTTSASPLRVANVAEGWYYIVVTGVGDGTASTGWTDYASLGQYQLTVNYATPSPGLGPKPVVPPPPPLTVALKASSYVVQRTVNNKNSRVAATLAVIDGSTLEPLRNTAVSITHTWTLRAPPAPPPPCRRPPAAAAPSR